jgi:hypothetical protein
MVQRGDGLCFSLETRNKVRAVHERAWQHLDRHVTSKSWIMGVKDRGHSALAEFTDNFVATNFLD